MGGIVEKTIEFFAGKRKLQGILHLPGDGMYPLVIGSHGLFADKTSPKQIALAKACAKRKIAFFRFDHKGCGQSQGDMASDTSVASRCEDVAEALKAAGKQSGIDGGNVGLFGSSFGGTVCLQCAGLINGGPIVVWAAPLAGDPVLRSLQRAQVYLAGQIKAQQLRFDIAAGLHVGNILVMHAENDEVVPVSDAHRIFTGARYPKQLQIFKAGDHRMDNPTHQQIFLQESVNWYQRHFSPNIS